MRFNGDQAGNNGTNIVAVQKHRYWLLGPFKVWTGLRERRRAADTLRRRRRGGGAFVSLDRITGTTPTVGTLSRTARTGPTRSWKMSAAKTCMGWEGDKPEEMRRGS